MEIKVLRKRIKNIYISIDEKGMVKVSAPLNTPDFIIKSIIYKKMGKLTDLIEKKKNSYIDLAKAKKIPYLGKLIPVKHINSEREYFEYNKNTLYLYSKTLSKKIKEKLILKWYFKEAERVINYFIYKYSPIIGKKINRITIKKMKTRWGSCNNKKGYLNFNLWLIQKSIKGIEFVVVHELVHLIHPNHGAGFYKTLASILPDWKSAKQTLYIPYSSVIEKNI